MKYVIGPENIPERSVTVQENEKEKLGRKPLHSLTQRGHTSCAASCIKGKKG